MSCPTLTPEQENVIRHVLERNHTYYVAQGMSRPHMWPEELLSEIRSELTHAAYGAPTEGTPEDLAANRRAETVANLAISLGQLYNSKR